MKNNTYQNISQHLTTELSAAEKSSRKFRTLNWFIPIAIAIIGVIISSDVASLNKSQHSRTISLVLGAISAGLAVCHKTIEPGIKTEFHNKRIRGLEYIKTQIDNESGNFTNEELSVLIVRTKENPDKVIQVFNMLYDNLEGDKVREIFTGEDYKSMPTVYQDEKNCSHAIPV